MADFWDSTKVMQATLALVKFWLVLNGLYIWEFITTLDYEWSVIRRRRPYRWTIWIYSLARTAGLIGILLGLVGMEVESRLNCQLLISSTLILSYLSTAATSLLIVLRIIAVWDRNKVVAATAYSIWGINVAFLIQAVVRLRTTWIPERKRCMVINSETGMPTLISIVITDVVLLLIVLVGLLRLCRYGGGRLGLTHFLWKQGVIWLLIAVAAEVPPVVFIILNLNDAFNLMFQSSSLVTMTIAATRMHRSLVDFATAPPNLEYEAPLSGPSTAPKTNRTRTSSPYNPMVVAVHEVFEQHPPLQTSDHGSRISTDEQVHEKSDKMSPGDDVERAM